MVKVSIIVPVYNAREYLEDTVHALLEQTLTDYEILLIDDGSTDGSGELCHSLTKKHPQVSAYTIPNGGPGHARNFGIQQAQGEYIGFCDADDLPDPKMYATLLSGMVEHKADVALCDIYSERDGRTFGFPWDGTRRFAGKEFWELFFAGFLGNTSDNDSTVPVWGSVDRCFYKQSIIRENGLSFPEDISFAEDLVFTLRYLTWCKSAWVCDQPLYRYVWNPSSLMNSHVRYEPDMLKKRLKLVGYIENIITKLPNAAQLEKRLMTTQRCYYHECVGNACRKTEGRKTSYREIREILHHPKVEAAFVEFDAVKPQKRLLYTMIARKRALLLWGYYQLRLHR